MDIKISRFDHNIVFKLSGELDHHSAGEFKKWFEVEWERQEGARNLVINFENVTFMDSSGVGAIIGRYKQVNRKGGQVAICSPSKAVKKILEMSGLPRIVTIYKNQGEALQKINTPH